ncbi:MAG: triose-phosphate isomerase [Christensenellaceae bacterium]|jgi:triosephosphate isomerase|nr:triose-phosphate isomerase [Christensenellaceae bacterium]
MRKPIIAGNWKMNNTIETTKSLISEIIPLVKDAKCEVVVCVPFTDLEAARKAIRGSNIKLGAQNVHWAPKGAFTGEISAEMLKELKVEYVIIGHSERRQYFGETDETVNKRTKAAIAMDLKPIVCVGETLNQRESGLTSEVVKTQIVGALKDIEKESLKKIVVAYEPVWAIGTGKTATASDANDTIAVIRKAIQGIYGSVSANAMRIQYGGSMNPQNATELMGMPEIDGGLIGGASLKAQDFAKVINY